MIAVSEHHPNDSPRMRALWRAHALGFTLVDEAPPTVVGELPFAGGVVRVKVAFTADYPDLPPRVWRVGPSGEVLGGFVGHHTYAADQSLCLFRETGGEGAWRGEYGLDEVLDRVRGQAEGSAAGTITEHGSDLDLPLVGVGKPLIMSAPQAAMLQGTGGPAWGWIKAVISSKIGMAITTAVSVGSALHGALQQVPAPWLHEPHPLMPWQTKPVAPREGLWLRVPYAPWTSLLPDASALEGLIRAHLNKAYHPPARSAPFWVLVRGAGERDMIVIHNLSLIRQAGDGGLPFDAGLLATAWVKTAELPGAFFARNTPLTAPALAEAHVAMVGLGSLGAPVAILLAQAGVRRFTLFDPDKLQPENLSRYPVGAEGLSSPKVALVHAKILDHNPWAEVVAYPHPPLASADSLAALKVALDDPQGLIVCTCADEHVEGDLNRLAVQHNRPLIIGAAIGAAEHATILRVLPGESACVQCVRLHERDDPDRFPQFKPAEGAGSWAYAGEGIAGLGLDTQEIAAKIARHALQTLGARLGGLPYGDAWGDHLLWTRVGGWVFDHPGQTLRVPTTRRADCPVCHPQPTGSLVDEQALMELLSEERPASDGE